ncbi:MAG: hypothetical protein LLG42_12080 [Chloroflexi bacterium]|nr:hypothetical protein [Chloroflexota bacterium]
MSSHLKFPGKLADWVHFNGKIEQPLNQPAWFNQTIIQTGAQEVFFSHWDHFFLPWGLAPHDLPGTRRVIRWIDEMSAACPGVRFKRLFPS